MGLYATYYRWDDHPDVEIEVIQEADGALEAYERCTETLRHHALYGYGRWTPLSGRVLKPGSRVCGVFRKDLVN
jgi:hypothetical protein